MFKIRPKAELGGSDVGWLKALHHFRFGEYGNPAHRPIGSLIVWGPTKSYAATRTLLKAWSGGGVPAADAVMLDIAMDLFNTDDCTRGSLDTAKAFDLDMEPPDMVFDGR